MGVPSWIPDRRAVTVRTAWYSRARQVTPAAMGRQVDSMEGSLLSTTALKKVGFRANEDTE